MNMAAIQYKDARQDTRQIPAEAALEMATIHGAEALGLGAELGSIEVGKKADLVLFDILRPEWQALWNPVNNLVYNADGRSVHTVIVDGRVVVDAYRQTFVDEPGSSPRCRTSASGCRRGPGSASRAPAGRSAEATRGPAAPIARGLTFPISAAAGMAD